jgi:hypothetical protein
LAHADWRKTGVESCRELLARQCALAVRSCHNQIGGPAAIGVARYYSPGL